MSSYQTSKREAAHEDSAWSVLWTAGDKIVSGSIDETVKVHRACRLGPCFLERLSPLLQPPLLSPLSSLHTHFLILAAHTLSCGGCMEGCMRGCDHVEWTEQRGGMRKCGRRCWKWLSGAAASS